MQNRKYFRNYPERRRPHKKNIPLTLLKTFESENVTQDKALTFIA